MNRRRFLYGAAGLGVAPLARARESRVISLAGRWGFRLGPEGAGPLTDEVNLPGTTDENRRGTPADPAKPIISRLTRRFSHVGPACYAREVEIPGDWAGKQVSLFLERTKSARIFVNGRLVGAEASLSTPHVHDLSEAMTPGRHTLLVEVDNTRNAPGGDSHAVTDQTQTNWNGILGRMELRAADPVWIRGVQVTPDAARGAAVVRVKIGNRTAAPVSGWVRLAAEGWNHPKAHRPPARRHSFRAAEGETALEIEYPMGREPLLWDEFTPALYRLTVSLEAGGHRDLCEIAFGMRDFRRAGTQFSINGRTVFLRGKTDCCVFPLTGYPPMDMAGWLRVLRIAQSYGINHYRFHSWCPPEAAFDAADRLGIYMQPELHVFGGKDFTDPERRRLLTRECERILEAYGHHPSFVMFAWGNEISAGGEEMDELTRHARALDPSRLYAAGSNNFYQEPQPPVACDYWTTYWTAGKWAEATGGPDEKYVRGSFAKHWVGHVNNRPPSTMTDYRASIQGVAVPVISHEIGQYQVYPRIAEAAKYTGVLRAQNIEAVRDRLEAAHMLDQADDFVRASGALAVICYREEIEAALRTPGFGGFQLLDLQDFPGQGTALVGILDAFMDSKGLITPEEWRRFCAPVVALARMRKYCWTAEETFEAELQVANYGRGALPEGRAQWVLRSTGGVLESGSLKAPPIRQGGLTSIGVVRAPLGQCPTPSRVEFEISLAGGAVRNSYPVWVYPAQAEVRVPPAVHVRRAFDDETRAILARGGRVLLIPEPGQRANSAAGAFVPDFWCYPMFERYSPPGTMGILCNPEHPALAGFPTSFHSDWQWWHIVKHLRPVILDEADPAFRPVVQVIDNFRRNHRLGLIFEAQVGAGRCLVCSADLPGHRDQPAPRQLLRSLLAYMASESFQPAARLDAGTLARLLGNTPGAASA